MTEQGQGLVPKLRFPEFRDDAEWVATPLRQLCTPISEKVGNAKLTPVSITAGKGFVSQASKFGRDISGEQYRNYTFLRKGDFAYNKGNSTAFPQGYVCQLTEFDEAAASSAFLCFQLNEEQQPRFIQALFDQNVHGRQLASFITSGARSNGLLNIRSDDFYGVKLPLPPEAAEQQKIAECLLSLDALIDAEKDKLAALRDHKKGLMQQLFPRPERIENGEKIPAENTPRLRFPEFRSAGEWEWTTVDAIAEIFKGKGISKADIISDGQQPCVRYGELYTTYGEVIDEVTSRTNVPKRDLFMSRANDVIIPSSGETKIDIATAACVLRDDIALGGDLNVIRSAHDGTFLSYFFNGPLKYSIAKVAQGDSVVHLYPSQIGSLNIAIPSADEQKRIADTMFAVDRALVERRNRITALTAHKSGLMQQLFPSPCEAAE